MMWLTIFFSFFLVSLKEYTFFSSVLDFSDIPLFMFSISFIVLFLISLFHFPLLDSKKKMIFNFSFVFLVFFVSGSFLSVSPLLFLILVELTIWPMSFLFLNFSKDSDKLSSLMLMIFINIFGSVPFMVFCASSVFSSESLFMVGGLEGGSSFFLIFFCFSMVLLSKIPVFLAHFWLSKAHVSASGAISMILASLMIKMGSFGLYKFSMPFLKFNDMYMPIFVSLALVGSIYVIFFMVRSSDIKLLIACSSILHMSNIFPLTTFYQTVSLTSCMLMGVSHGLISFFLFFLVSILYESSLSRSWESSASLESLSKMIPLSLFLFLFFNLGVPPLSNFYSEILFCSFYFSYSLFSLFLVSVPMVVSVVFTMIFVTKIIFGKMNIFIGLNLPDSLYFLSFSFLLFLFLVPFLI